jgi:hypothetical protein
VDISQRDSYFIDLFRAAEGAEHTRFLHGHFGQISAQGLSLVSMEETRFGPVMRGFKRDSHPAAGWSVDWNIEDHLKYLPPSRKVHLRHTDLTRGAEVELAQTWVSVGLYGGTAEAWIPSVLVRRRAAEPPLCSTFVGVLEPHEGKSNIAAIRRLELEDAEAKLRPDADVCIEVLLADGHRDIFISRNVEASSASSSAQSATALVVEKESGARFDGALCLIRLNPANRPERVFFCQGRSLWVGELCVRAKNQEASFEIDLTNKAAPIVGGPAEAVDFIEVAGARIWPK